VYAGPGLHCIYPTILDLYWQREADQGRMPGNLKKRVQCAAAGQAAIHTVSQGIGDILTCIPGLSSSIALNLTDFQDWANAMWEPGARWHKAINRNLYPPTTDAVLATLGQGYSESEMAAVAATVISVYQKFAETSPLLSSAALQRVAGGAPVTGVIMGDMIKRAVKRLEIDISVTQPVAGTAPAAPVAAAPALQ
jgi:hypothetical protein